MANVVRDPREHPDAIIPDLEHQQRLEVHEGAGGFGLRQHLEAALLHQDRRRLLSRSRCNGTSATRSGSSITSPTAGADWWTAFYPPDNMQRPTGPTCDGCHSVDYDIHTKQVTEWNVGCERCHGPGSEHVAHPTRGNILNPAQMDDVAANDTCIQCHSQGQPLTKQIEGKAYDWPVGYQVGLHLQDYLEARRHHAGPDDLLPTSPTEPHTRTECRAMTSCRA